MVADIRAEMIGTNGAILQMSSPSKRVEKELRSNPKRSNTEIGKTAKTSSKTVQRTRKQMEASGSTN
jgi:hypothetical protein